VRFGESVYWKPGSVHQSRDLILLHQLRLQCIKLSTTFRINTLSTDRRKRTRKLRYAESISWDRNPRRPQTIQLLINQLVNIKDETGEFLLRLDDGRVIDTKGWNGWEWTHGIGLYGLWNYHTLTGSPKALALIEAWFANRFQEGGTTKNINTMAAMLTLAFLYEKTGSQPCLAWLESWADWAMYELPRTKYGGMSHMTYNSMNSQELWDDTLMMTVLPLAKIGKLLNRPHYVEEAKRQFLLHIKYLFDTRTGLF
jgi:unsaturated rhamnogalacturonyl hydrolase